MVFRKLRKYFGQKIRQIIPDLKYIQHAIKYSGRASENVIDTLCLSVLLFPRKPYHVLGTMPGFDREIINVSQNYRGIIINVSQNYLVCPEIIKEALLMAVQPPLAGILAPYHKSKACSHANFSAPYRTGPEFED